MKKKYIKYNSRALDLEAIKESNRKVTLGFKCNPSLKIRLAEEAQECGLTLSTYTESFIEDAQNLSATIEQLQHKIHFYENDLLNALFEKYKNTTLKYINQNGMRTFKEVKTIEDAYTILINSFK
jgi:hypothetical protein